MYVRRALIFHALTILHKNNLVINSYDIDSTTIFQQNTTTTDNYTQWSYSTALPNNAIITVIIYQFLSPTTIDFASQILEFSPQQMKVTYSVKNWNFATLQNSLTLVLASNVSGSPEVQKAQNLCNNVTTYGNDAEGNMREKGKKGILDELSELWDDKQYEEEFNLDGFLKTMKA